MTRHDHDDDCQSRIKINYFIIVNYDEFHQAEMRGTAFRSCCDGNFDL